MKINHLVNALSLYLVTDSKWSSTEKPLIDSVQEALEGGVTIVQIREKELDTQSFMNLAEPIINLCHAYGVPCIINDNLEVALATNADGLHIGQEDGNVQTIRAALGPNKILGVSAHTLEEARQAWLAGADYLGVGSVFPTKTKKDATSVSLDLLQAIVNTIPIPVVAIGGITSQNISALQGTSIAGVALVSAILGEPHVVAATSALAEQVATYLKPLPPVLTIAGSDSSGGAGIQADLKTMQANGVYGMSVITAVTAQNTQGVSHIEVLSQESIAKQLQAIAEDIRPKAIKIGMLANADIIHAVAQGLAHLKEIPTVIDPVMVATSGSHLLESESIGVLEKELFPYADIITPNIPEAQVLSGKLIGDKKDMEAVAKMLGKKYDCAILLKGGHGVADADDFFWSHHESQWFSGKRIANTNTHGTGCTLSSAIASFLAKGATPIQAINQAKWYVTTCLRAQLNLGKGRGPMRH